MTPFKNTIRPITYAFELLDWILEQAIRTGPQVPVANVVIDILNELITEIHACGSLPARGEPGVYAFEILDVLSKPSNVTMMSAELLEFVHDTLVAVTFLDQELELHQVIEQIARVARLHSVITFKKTGNEVRIKSARDLIDSHGVMIDVVVLQHVRVRSALRPWHPKYGWEVVPDAPKSKKKAGPTAGRAKPSPRRPADPRT